MYEVTVEAAFSPGHYLRHYHGKCENPHGHNYRVLVTLAGKQSYISESSMGRNTCYLRILNGSAPGTSGQSALSRAASLHWVSKRWSALSEENHCGSHMSAS